MCWRFDEGKLKYTIHYSIQFLMLKFFLVNFKQMKGQSNGNDKKGFNFDAEHERKRKDQMKKLLERTQKDIEEEQMLLNELKKIEQRKKERDRKTQDLQKLISQADQVSGQYTVHTMEFFKDLFYLFAYYFDSQQGEAPQTPTSSRKQDKKVNKKKLPNQIRPSRVDFVVNVSQTDFFIFCLFLF